MPNKYDKLRSMEAKPQTWAVHPVWRGIGCLMMIVIPIISYAGAVLLVQGNSRQGWVRVTYELSQAVEVPFLGSIPYLYANLLVTLVLMLVGFALLNAVYALLRKATAPPGPIYEVGPVRRRAKGR